MSGLITRGSIGVSKPYLIVAGALALALAAPAGAGWQSTEWGMTPAQVVAASQGRAMLNTGSSGQKISGDTRTVQATGTHVSGEHRFETTFYFRNDTRLALIKMELKEAPTGCGPLNADLQKLYGKPVKEEKSSVVTFIHWDDKAKNNRVKTVQIGTDYCSLEYEPLRDDNTAGL